MITSKGLLYRWQRTQTLKRPEDEKGSTAIHGTSTVCLEPNFLIPSTPLQNTPIPGVTPHPFPLHVVHVFLVLLILSWVEPLQLGLPAVYEYLFHVLGLWLALAPLLFDGGCEAGFLDRPKKRG